ncbi:MAG: aminopeptidase P family N-terminal domain-containing protein, partial [Gemmatimonas sp.]
MTLDRRRFLGTAALSAGTLALGCTPKAGGGTSGSTPGDSPAGSSDIPAVIRALKPMTAGVVPISEDERKTRIARAQTLMGEQKIDAIFMEGTTSCFYYTGMRWGQSERTFGVIIPANGKIAYVCPGFEEDRVRELFKPVFGDEIRVWQEDESPYDVIVGIIKDRG